jgi:hypothetical protein
MDPSSWRPAEPRQCKHPKWQNNNSDTMTTNDGLSSWILINPLARTTLLHLHFKHIEKKNNQTKHSG